jgi:putative methyltransferase (TIGR04325 family)
MGVLLRNVIKQMVPPLLLGTVRWVRGMCGTGIKFSGNYAYWEDALRDSSGYDADEILVRVEEATSLVVSGDAAYERDSVLFDKIPHSFPVLSGLLRAAIENGSNLTVLDFGGSLGSSYRQCKEFISVIPNLEWRVVEQDQFVRRGRERFETERLRFFGSPKEAIEFNGRAVDIVLLSNVLQYIERPFETLKELSSVGSRYMIINCIPFANIETDRLVVQRVPSSIYASSYPCWIFSRKRFLACLDAEWDVLAEFESTDGFWLVGGLRFEFSGLMLRRRG